MNINIQYTHIHTYTYIKGQSILSTDIVLVVYETEHAT